MDQFDVIGLSETWTEKGTWRKINNKVPKKFEWLCIPAEREKARGRAFARREELW